MNQTITQFLKKYKIGFIGNKDTTYECLRRFLADGFEVSQLITLTPKQAKKFHLSGYMNLAPLAEKYRIPIYYPEKFSLKSKKDAQAIKAMAVDLLICNGWQRIIPKKVLDVLRIGACGMHGSAWGMPRGRGHSVFNWSLIQGKKKFVASLFLFTPKVDAGDIIASAEFEITPFDTIKILQLKEMLLMSRLLKKYVPLLLAGKVKLKPQKGKVSYYPQRKPEDGAIDWNLKTDQVYNFVRSLTRPYPGAFSFLKKEKVVIWRSQPFDRQLTFPRARNGEVVEKFNDGRFLVKTRDGSLLVIDYEGIALKKIKKGAVFTSLNHKKTLRRIIKRYPDWVKKAEQEIKR